ncbi:MAG: hypothetical protein GX047_00395, partial [Firmicutes bacterium]|nr:hypothetical protein [Bacillota bacterium]
MNRFLRGISLYLLIAIIAVSSVSSLYPGIESSLELGYGDFINQLENGQVKSAQMIGDQTVQGVVLDVTK